MTLPLIIAGAAAGLIAGPRIRASVFSRSTESGQPPRRACPVCAQDILPDRWQWRSLLPVTGRCPSCRARIGPYPLAAELAAGLALAVVAARVSSGWELAALTWLALLAVPLAFIDVAVHRLPDPLTVAACAGTLGLLAVAALTGHQPGHLGQAAIGAALAWISWQALLTGTVAAFVLAGVYGGILLARHRATRSTHMALGPFILIGALAAIAL